MANAAADETAQLTSTEISAHNIDLGSASQAKLPRVSVRRTDETGDASLYIDLKEVLKIRSNASGMTPIQRVTVIQDRLKHFLQNGGNSRDIKPGEEGQNIVIRAGESVLVTVNAETAKKSGLTPKQLAFLWTNLLRDALGADPLTRDASLIASRGFSPAISQLRQSALNSSGVMLRGMASWYGPGFHGRRCANGERFNMNALTAAHKTLPFNTLVRVTNTRNGRTALVRITDRGPYAHGRVIDLSKGAAHAIGMLSSGTAPVTVEVLGR